ncbi:hypothetical protein T265_03484 [Opisthorchis viverrini]|uniref:Uncharacterized protein n=2 Tax=Opisthorchis viverrini TaxID=6198 RepID=A0A075AHJ7_OPIVI|nr:hypothetical protein T265_03484 [Opisthorchis viverrini]KER30004.1 hypothetical protein T265_03484 [Opisthorchis viverrini]
MCPDLLGIFEIKTLCHRVCSIRSLLRSTFEHHHCILFVQTSAGIRKRLRRLLAILTFSTTSLRSLQFLIHLDCLYKLFMNSHYFVLL